MSVIRRTAKTLFAAADVFLALPKGPRVLLYHQVGAGLGRQMEVEVSHFQEQLDWLVENREVVSFDTAMDRWHEEDSDRLAVITFDDGYRDTYETAFPMLKERGLPFSLYLATESVDSRKALGPTPQADPIRWSEVEEMLGSGLVTVGSHTHTHRDLRHASMAEIEYELMVSDVLISDRLGVASRHFAYPWGYWAPHADSLVRERYASAVLGGSPCPDPNPPAHMLHRYPIQLDDGVAFFKARVVGGILFEERVRRRLRGYAGP